MELPQKERNIRQTISTLHRNQKLLQKSLVKAALTGAEWLSQEDNQIVRSIYRTNFMLSTVGFISFGLPLFRTSKLLAIIGGILGAGIVRGYNLSERNEILELIVLKHKDQL